MTAFDTLAEFFEVGRIGYSNDVYNNLISFGLKQSHNVLDIACGTGLASGPLIVNNFRVAGIDVSQTMLDRAKARYPSARWVIGDAEKIALADGSADVVICAQAIHLLDRDAVLNESMRVLRPGGLLSIWWKQLSSDDPIKMLRDSVLDDLGLTTTIRNRHGFPMFSEGMSGGFKELYAMPFKDQCVRVIPWRTTQLLAKFLQYERSRAEVYDTAGARANEYFNMLEQRLCDRFGALDAVVQLAFTHFQYLARK
jgi:ubiquinone/menaquinone biosynthesis C-methylase UbiE